MAIGISKPTTIDVTPIEELLEAFGMSATIVEKILLSKLKQIEKTGQSRRNQNGTRNK
jgi:hypothetical protein